MQFVFHGTGVELEHLKAPGEKDKAVMMAKIKEMSTRGMRQRDIAEAIGVSVSTVNKYVKLE